MQLKDFKLRNTEHPELAVKTTSAGHQGQLSFLAIVQPSRTDLGYVGILLVLPYF